MQFCGQKIPLLDVQRLRVGGRFVRVGHDDEAVCGDGLNVHGVIGVGGGSVGLAGGRCGHDVLWVVGRKIVAAGREKVKSCC